MHELVDIERFALDLLPELPGCPIPALERRVRDAVIEACERAPLWTVTLPEIPVALEQVCFDLPPTPGQTDLHDIVRVLLSGLPLRNVPLEDTGLNPYLQVPNHGHGYHVPKRGQIEFNFLPNRASTPLNAPEPRETRGLDVTVSVKPAREADRVSAQLYRHHYQLVIDGALAYAFDMRDTPWYDPGQAQKRRVAFEYEIVKVKQSIDTGFSQRPLRVRPRRF